MMAPSIPTLARAFGAALRADLGHHYAAAVNANRRERDAAVCHTHDYIDAYETMERAFCGLAHRLPRPADADLIDAAWTMWRRDAIRHDSAAGRISGPNAQK